MGQAALLQRILAVCRGREFNTVEDLATHIPEASPEVIQTSVIGLIRRGLLGGLIDERLLIDGPIVTVSYIRG